MVTLMGQINGILRLLGATYFQNENYIYWWLRERYTYGNENIMPSFSISHGSGVVVIWRGKSWEWEKYLRSQGGEYRATVAEARSIYIIYLYRHWGLIINSISRAIIYEHKF